METLGRGSMLDGVVAAIESGWFQAEIAEASYAFHRKVAAGDWVQIGASGFTDGGDDERPPTLYIDPAVEERQRKRLATVKHDRSSELVADALARLAEDAADPTVNLMPGLLAAAAAYATVGEVTQALSAVFGCWVEAPRL